MQTVMPELRSPDRNAVALKAFGRIAEAWSLTVPEAAGLADMSESTWKRARKPGYAWDLTQDQMLRLSELIGIDKSMELYFDAPFRASGSSCRTEAPNSTGFAPWMPCAQEDCPKSSGSGDMSMR